VFGGGKYPRFLSVGGGKSTVSYYDADQSVMQIWTGSAEVAAAWNVNGQLVSYGVCGFKHGALTVLWRVGTAIDRWWARATLALASDRARISR